MKDIKESILIKDEEATEKLHCAFAEWAFIEWWKAIASRKWEKDPSTWEVWIKTEYQKFNKYQKEL